MTKFPQIITFGCRLNMYESEVIRAHALAAGLDEIVLVNSCAVTGEAERQTRQALRKARRENPSALIAVTGCAAQIYPEKFAEMEEVDVVIGNLDKMKAETYFNLREKKKHLTDFGAAPLAQSPLVEGFEGLSRAFVQIQNGCNHRCTFCLIPYGRGPSRSVELDRIAQQVRMLAQKGYHEMALTGVDITSYGKDLSDDLSLGGMVKELLEQVPEVKRLRLSSLDPAEIDEDLWNLIENEPRLMPCLHLSVQAGDDMILKRMKRRHTRADIYDLVTRARELRPDIVFGADVIAGFPTEENAMFENTRNMLEELDFTWLHVFPYSARTGTPAAKMPQVKGTLRKERAALLREVGAQAAARHLKGLVGKRLELHVEKPLLARTPSFAEVILTSEQEASTLVMAEIVDVQKDKAVGKVIR